MIGLLGLLTDTLFKALYHRMFPLAGREGTVMAALPIKHFAILNQAAPRQAGGETADSQRI